MDGSRGTKDENVFVGLVGDVVVMAYVSSLAMFRHIGNGVAHHTVDDKQQGEEDSYADKESFHRSEICINELVGTEYTCQQDGNHDEKIGRPADNLVLVLKQLKS